MNCLLVSRRTRRTRQLVSLHLAHARACESGSPLHPRSPRSPHHLRRLLAMDGADQQSVPDHGLDLSVDGDFLWLATGYGVQLIEDGSIVASIGLPGSTRIVRASRQRHRVRRQRLARSTRSDAKDNKITILNSVTVTGTVNDLEIISTALFAATTNGIAHFDLVDPVRAVPDEHRAAVELRERHFARHGEKQAVRRGWRRHRRDLLGDHPLAAAAHRHARIRAAGQLRSRHRRRFRVRLRSIRPDHRPLRQRHDAARTHAGRSRPRSPPSPARRTSSPVRIARCARSTFRPVAHRRGLCHRSRHDRRHGQLHSRDGAVGNTLYVAAGDIGLVVLDATTIARPYPLASTAAARRRACASSADKAWFSTAAGRITAAEDRRRPASR